MSESRPRTPKSPFARKAEQLATELKTRAEIGDETARLDTIVKDGDDHYRVVVERIAKPGKPDDAGGKPAK